MLFAEEIVAEDATSASQSVEATRTSNLILGALGKPLIPGP